MFERLRIWLRRRGSLDRREHTVGDHSRTVENYDAVAAVGSHISSDGNNVPFGGGMPPGYVKAYDEGRPRK